MTMVRSILLYGCETWSILANSHKQRIQIIQNKCLNIIFEAPRYTRISDLHIAANFPYIEVLLNDRVHKMSLSISLHKNPLVRSVGHLYQGRAVYRNIFQRVLPDYSGDSSHQGED